MWALPWVGECVLVAVGALLIGVGGRHQMLVGLPSQKTNWRREGPRLPTSLTATEEPPWLVAG